MALHDGLAEDQRCGREEECKAQHQIDQAARGFAVEIKPPQHKERHDTGRNAAAREPDHRRPVDALFPAIRQAADSLGRRCIQQIGADGGRRVDTEQQNQQRRHQRAAADAGHADQQADTETGGYIKRIDHQRLRIPGSLAPTAPGGVDRLRPSRPLDDGHASRCFLTGRTFVLATTAIPRTGAGRCRSATPPPSASPTTGWRKSRSRNNQRNLAPRPPSAPI